MIQFSRSLSIIFVIFFLSSQSAIASDYPTKVGEKLGHGIANVVTAVAEVPKTMMVTGHQKGATYGMTAGFFIGLVHMGGRLFTGALDIATFMVPTTPIPQPEYIWDDFDKETTYKAWEMR